MRFERDPESGLLVPQRDVIVPRRRFALPIFRRYGATQQAMLAQRIAGGSFSPGDLPDLTVWLEADADVYSTGTTQAVAGDFVSTWVNESTAGDATNTAPNRPTFRSPGGGFPYVEFDGTTAFLNIPDGAGVELNGDFTLIAALRPRYNAGNINHTIISKDSAAASAGAAFLYLEQSSSKLNFDRPYVEAGVPSTNTYADNTWTVASFRLSGTGSAYYKDGAANGTDTIATGTATSQPLRIGYFTDGTNNFYGRLDLFGLLICTSALSNANLDAAEDYLGGKAGVTITH